MKIEFRFNNIPISAFSWDESLNSKRSLGLSPSKYWFLPGILGCHRDADVDSSLLGYDPTYIRLKSTDLSNRITAFLPYISNFFKLCVEMEVLSINYFSLIFLYNMTHGFLTWSGLVFYLLCVVVVLFFYVMVHFLYYSIIFCVTVFFCFIVLFIVINSSVFFFLLCMCTCLYILYFNTGTGCKTNRS